MKTDKNKKGNAELRKVATRAFKKVMDSLKDEPSVVIVSGSTDSVLDDSSIDEIVSWLFHRRDENGS